MNRINIEFFKFLVFLILTILFLIMCITLDIYYYLWVVAIFALLTGLFFWKYRYFKNRNDKDKD
ncbi:Uncharacterised protein [Staphylococcus aureus]|nr:Uncharacterised protein [Staphylococcus aureus]